MVLTLEFVDKILKCDHSNESYRVVLSCGAVYCAVQIKMLNSSIKFKVWSLWMKSQSVTIAMNAKKITFYTGFINTRW